MATLLETLDNGWNCTSSKQSYSRRGCVALNVSARVPSSAPLKPEACRRHCHYSRGFGVLTTILHRVMGLRTVELSNNSRQSRHCLNQTQQQPPRQQRPSNVHLSNDNREKCQRVIFLSNNDQLLSHSSVKRENKVRFSCYGNILLYYQLLTV